MTAEDAVESFRLRYVEGLAVNLADVEERTAVMLEEREEVEARVLRMGPHELVRVFLRLRPDGAWLSAYAWTLASVDALVRRFLASLEQPMEQAS